MRYEEIKKTDVIPKEQDKKSLLEYDNSNEKKPIETIVIDDRYDYPNVDIFDKIQDSNLFLRPAFPWEDEDSFEKISKQSAKDQFDIKNEEKQKNVIVKTTKKIVRKKAKVKNVKDIVKIVQPSSFSHIPMGRTPTMIYGGGPGGIASGMYTSYTGGDYEQGNAEQEKTKVIVSNMLKNAGLSRGQAAGIMGNMQVESKFKVGALNPSDAWTNAPSIGLVQYNGLSYVGTRDAQKMFDVIGRTAERQVNYLFNTKKYKRFIKESSPYPYNPAECCFLFAKYFEGCSICTSRQKFSGEGGKRRTAFAIGFYERFNNPSSPLFWGTVLQGMQSSTTSIQNQSSSGGEFVYKINPFSIRFYSKGNGVWSVKDLINEAKEKFGINNAINLSFYSPSMKWDPPYKDDKFADYTMYHKNLMWIDSTGIHIKKFGSGDSAPRNAKYIVASVPMAVVNGAAQELSLTGRQADKAQRTAVGVTNDGQAIIYVCTSKDIIQARDSIMKIPGIRDALFLDGGGSTFLMKDNKFLVNSIDMKRKLPNILTW